MALRHVDTSETQEGVQLRYLHDDHEIIVRLVPAVRAALPREYWTMMAQYAIGKRLRQRALGQEIVVEKDEEDEFRRKVLRHVK